MQMLSESFHLWPIRYSDLDEMVFRLEWEMPFVIWCEPAAGPVIVEATA